MAEEKGKRKRRDPTDERPSRGSGSRQRSREGRLSGAQLAQRARRDLAEITGLEAEGVTSLERDADGTWRVTVELLELSRIPETDDMLGSYEAELDEDGELLGYRRVRRYARSQADEGRALQGR
jgi:Gas vesicle synthesis protein GvpO